MMDQEQKPRARRTRRKGTTKIGVGREYVERFPALFGKRMNEVKRLAQDRGEFRKLLRDPDA